MTQEEFYSALMRLRGNPDFAVVMRHVEELREADKEKLVTAPKGKRSWFQGHAQAYGTLIDAVKDAPNVIQRMNH